MMNDECVNTSNAPKLSYLDYPEGIFKDKTVSHGIVSQSAEEAGISSSEQNEENM